MLKKLKDFFINNPKLKMFEFKLPQTPVLKTIYNQINESLMNAYRQPMMKKYLTSLPTKTLLDQSVVMYVGSKTRPKNQTMTRELLDLAKVKAIKIDHLRENKRSKLIKAQKSEQQQKQAQALKIQENKQLNLVKYYTAYFMKRAALQSGNQANFSLSTQNMIELVQKGHPLSCYLVANQLMRYIETISNSQQIQHSLHRCLELYETSVTQNHFGGVLHIGEILQKATINNAATSYDQIQDFYVFSAAYGNSIALYKLAYLYKKKGNISLYIKYLKQSAEKGVLQGQHDLAIQYLQGKNIKKDQFKAFSWFNNAGAHNFIQSKFNAGQIFLKGTSCGKILPNKKAALIYFQQINKTGQMDVTSHIKNLLQDEQLQKELNLNQTQQTSKDLKSQKQKQSANTSK